MKMAPSVSSGSQRGGIRPAAKGIALALLVSLPLCLPPLVLAGRGTLVTPRTYHTATLLADGRVMLAGGLDSAGATASSEIYNPASNISTATGSLNQRRLFHQTVLLSDGRVLTMGGITSGDAANVTSSAETYNAATGLWSTTANMITARSVFQAVVLADGRVLVIGGSLAASETASCEIYDPARGAWSPTGSLLQPRTQHRATLLADGRVLVAGGANQTAGLVAQSELYDPVTGTWSSSGSLTFARDHQVQLALADGRVLVAGGVIRFGFANHPSKITGTAEIYDLATGIWTRTGSLDTPRVDFAAVLLQDGKVFAAGGADFSGGLFSSIEEFNPVLGKWRTPGISLATPRSRHTATSLPDGSVVIAGGYNNDEGLVPSAELFIRPK